MESKAARKEAIQKFKERKPALGVFAVRCTASEQVWVDASRNLDAAKNGTWFGLRNGSHRDKSLQQEWNLHGESAFQYQILEKLDEDVHPLAIADLLKQSRTRWIAELGAKQIGHGSTQIHTDKTKL
jgi:hypothetical protein